MLLLTGLGSLQAQQKLSFSGKGYLSDIQSVMFESVDGSWINDNLIHNRLNANLYWENHLKITAEIRNRLLFGETVKYFPAYADRIDSDTGWADLSYNLLTDSSYILNSTIDRLYADLTIGRFQATVGRQRINWGMNYVWNPNDLFNSYSFFDFDYVERPGSDAIRLQYYLNSTASIEMASKLNSDSQWSVASLLRVNLHGTDIQLLGGIHNEEEYVLGGGFSGYFGPLSLSGEATFLCPYAEESKLEKAWLAGGGVSYQAPFDLLIQAEYLFNEAAVASSLQNLTDFYYRNLSLRDLSFSEHSVFINLSYPVTPLLNAGVSTMMFTQPTGFFFGPTIDLSLRNDLDLSFYVQHFKIDLSKQAEKMSLGFLRLKWSF